MRCAKSRPPTPDHHRITLMIQELSLKRVGFRDESMSQFLVMERKRYDAVHLHITSSKVLWLSSMACTHTHTHTFSWKLSVLKCLYGCLDAIAAICKVAGKLRDARRYRGMCSLLGTSAYLHAFYKQSVYVSPCASLVQRLHLVSFRCQDIFGPSLDSTSIKSTYLLTVWASCHRS